MVLESVLVSFFYKFSQLSQFYILLQGWPVFPARLVKEVVFFPLYILASFVEDKLSIGSWIYLWALYSVPKFAFSFCLLFPEKVLSVSHERVWKWHLNNIFL